MQNDSIDDLMKSLEKEKQAAAPHPPASKPKAEQIREALAKMDADAPSHEATTPRHEALPPLKRSYSSAPRAQGTLPSVPPVKPARSEASSGSAKKAAAQHPSGSAKKSSAKAAPQKASKKKKKGLRRLGVTPGMVGAAVGCSLTLSVIAGYVAVAMSYQGRFLPNTYINQKQVAGLNADAAEVALLGETNAGDLTLTTHKGNTVTIPAKNFGAKYSIPNGSFDEAFQENPFGWGQKLFSQSDYQVQYDFSYSEEALRALLREQAWGEEVSTDAKIVRDGEVFTIEPESQGDQFDEDILVKYIGEQLQAGNTHIDMEASGCYQPFAPKVTKDSLQEELKVFNNYANCTITFDLPAGKKVVDSEQIVDWIMTDDSGAVMMGADGNLSFNREAIAVFVAQMAAETDTYGTDRAFNATLDGPITVVWASENSSNYGWKIDQEATVAQLISLMRDGKSVTVEPEYASRAYVRGKDDIGNTYVEVDISAQHLWVYKEGAVVSESDFVSGTETNPDRRTPRGICQILYKKQDTVIGQMDDEGYEQPVAFWMPFNALGCGFHDLSRRAYGGQIYMTNGSHGCINLSYSYAKELYGLVETGMPVIVHD